MCENGYDPKFVAYVLRLQRVKDINHVDPQFVQYLWKRYSSISEEERAERRYQRLLNGPTRFAPQPKYDEKNLEEARKLLGITVRDKHKIPQSPKMIHTLSLKMTMLEWLTQKTWSKTKDCAKQKKRKKFRK